MEIQQGVADTDGFVTSVTASSPLSSSGGITPNISLTGIVPVANGGTGTSTQFTQGSVVFAGASGVYTQDNTNFFWDDTNNRLGIGTATPSAPIDLLKTGLGATPSDVSGVLIMNTTAAAAGAQQVSPSLTLEGQGWKTTATAASQSVRFQQYVLPVQGAANPTGTWTLASSINSAAYTTLMQMTSTGTMTLRSPTNPIVTLTWVGSDARTGTISLNGGLVQLTNGTWQITRDSSSGGLERFSAYNGNSVTTFFKLFDDNASDVMAQRNGTNANAFRVYNTSASSNANYERGVIDWQTTSNVLTIGTQAGGTGTLRSMSLVANGVSVNQATLGNSVLTVTSVAANDDPTETTYQNKVTTTDATVTTLATIAIPASTTVMIEARVTARRTGGSAGTAEDGAGYIVAATYKNVAGTATEIGENSIFSAEDQAAWDCTFTPSGANTLLQVTGAANNNISWVATYRVYTIST